MMPKPRGYILVGNSHLAVSGLLILLSDGFLLYVTLGCCDTGDLHKPLLIPSFLIIIYIHPRKDILIFVPIF